MKSRWQTVCLKTINRAMILICKKPPKLEKQFLISPPASPPEGWQPIKEDGPSSEQPGLHFELVARLAALNGGQSHEIIEPSTTTPAIILHACEVWKNSSF